MTDQAIIHSTLRELARRGAWATRPRASQPGRDGIPAIIGAYRGRPLALAVHQAGTHPSRSETRELAHAAKAGAIAAVITSPDQLSRLLDRIDAKTDPQPRREAA